MLYYFSKSKRLEIEILSRKILLSNLSFISNMLWFLYNTEKEFQHSLERPITSKNLWLLEYIYFLLDKGPLTTLGRTDAAQLTTTPFDSTYSDHDHFRPLFTYIISPFFCLPLLLFPRTVICKIISASLFVLVRWPYHFHFLFLLVVKRSLFLLKRYSITYLLLIL